MRKEIFILVLFLIPFISADVISLNSGGTGNIILNPNEYIEGFFWGDVCVPYTCISLGYYDCGTWDNGCEGTINCGSCLTGYSCQAGICTLIGTGDSPGGGGGATTTSPGINVDVFPTSFTMQLAIRTSNPTTIKVTNPGTSTIMVPVGLTNLSNMILLNTTSFELAPGESKNLDVTFVALSQTGNFKSNIIIGDESIPVEMIVRTKLLLFDSVIEVLNENAQVKQGAKLKTKITLIPMGDPNRLDVTLNYTIKDYNGVVYFTKTETMLIEEKMSFERAFSVNKIPDGKYVIGLMLIYPNGVAPSSAHFEIVSTLFGRIILILIILILIVLMLLIIFLIWKRRKEEEEPVEQNV